MENKTIIGLDVGNARIGVAVSALITRLPQPHGVIENNQETIENICRLAIEQRAVALVIGLPRGLNGQDTDQTKQVRDFVSELQNACHLPIHLQDEALTSKQAETELSKKHVRYTKEEVDALAATYILTDFLQEHPEVHDETK